MPNVIRTALLAAIIAAGVGGAAVSGPLEDADAAFARGDYATGLRLLHKLADQGDARAQVELGVMYVLGDGGLGTDDAEPVKWFRKAADQGNARAQFWLGQAYYVGRGVPQDYAEAMTWLRKAADQSNRDAESQVAWMYDQGQGVAQDYAEAAKWYRKSAEHGVVSDLFRLGERYAIGQGVPQDYTQAHMLFNLAASKNNEGESRDSAVRKRNEVAAKMTPAQIADAQKLAREWKPTK